MGYLYFVGSEKRGWVIANSFTDYANSPVFNSYLEIKHFTGYWLTKREKEDIYIVYDTWQDTYFSSSGKFKGKVNEWNYENLSIELCREKKK